MEMKNLAQRASEIKALYSKMEMEQYGKKWTDAQVMEGFVVDVGELMEIVMAKQGIRDMDNVDERLAHELADCLYSIFILADRYNVDLEKEFMSTMDKLETRLEKYKKN